jgi:hypothetical protein
VQNPSVKTYGEGSIHATFNTGTFLGTRGATITVDIDKPYPAEVQLHVKGVIRSDVVFEPSSVQFGDVEQGTAVDRQVTVNYNGGGDWQVQAVKSSNPSVSAKIVNSVRQQDGQVSCELAVHLSPNAPVGYLKDHVLLVTSDGQGEMPLAVEGRVSSGITVSPSSLFMGVVEPGKEATKSLVVKGHTAFRVLSITCDDKSFTFGREADTSAKKVHVIPVKFVAGASAGKVSQTIRIVTDLGQTTPELAAYAVVENGGADRD